MGVQRGAVRERNLLRGFVGRVAHERADAGRAHFGTLARGRKSFAQQELGQRAAADVACADRQDFFEHIATVMKKPALPGRSAGSGL
jgi:hypothetical protein